MTSYSYSVSYRIVDLTELEHLSDRAQEIIAKTRSGNRIGVSYRVGDVRAFADTYIADKVGGAIVHLPHFDGDLQLRSVRVHTPETPPGGRRRITVEDARVGQTLRLSGSPVTGIWTIFEGQVTKVDRRENRIELGGLDLLTDHLAWRVVD